VLRQQATSLSASSRPIRSEASAGRLVGGCPSERALDEAAAVDAGGCSRTVDQSAASR
jgi:hypothetical protein